MSVVIELKSKKWIRYVDTTGLSFGDSVKFLNTSSISSFFGYAYHTHGRQIRTLSILEANAYRQISSQQFKSSLKWNGLKEFLQANTYTSNLLNRHLYPKVLQDPKKRTNSSVQGLSTLYIRCHLQNRPTVNKI